jgi:hypothetical protein
MLRNKTKTLKLPGLVRFLNLPDGEDIASGFRVVLEAEPLVVHEEGRPGRDRERFPLSSEPHPQDRVLLAILDGTGQLNIAAWKQN